MRRPESLPSLPLKERRERKGIRQERRAARGQGESGMICWRGRKIDLGAGKEKEPLSGDVRF